MEALTHWRDATLAKRSEDKSQSSLQSTGQEFQSSAEEPRTDKQSNGTPIGELVAPQIDQVEKVETPVITKPSSSSWVQWWRSSRRNHSNGDAISVRRLAWIILEIYLFGHN